MTAIPPGCKATIAAALALKAEQDRKPFTMNADETDRAIAKLLSPSPQIGGQIGAGVGGQIGTK